ncbi:MAG: ribosome silencing factor [Hyphomicrobiales bacterium]|nr:ribosome silencing factor [Hyphomicrobiales bacterium]MBV8663094.1 ribosome silencing factor [Hyphomicrobiales bacterium]
MTSDKPAARRRKSVANPSTAVVSPAPVKEDALRRTILGSLENSKAEDVVAIDIAGKSTLADVMIIASGRSTVHVGAIADHLVKACREAGYPAPRVEGMPNCDWVLLDASDAIVHIFKPDVRQFYNLEKVWSADRPGETPSAARG